MPERRAPRLSDLKRALRGLKAQYQKRSEKAAWSVERMGASTIMYRHPKIVQ